MTLRSEDGKRDPHAPPPAPTAASSSAICRPAATGCRWPDRIWPRSTSRKSVTAGDLTSVTYRLDAAAPGRPPGELEFGATATIEAPPREVTKRTLKAEELLRVAGTRGDALKAIEYMPGVARGQMGFMIIRGSAPGRLARCSSRARRSIACTTSGT